VISIFIQICRIYNTIRLLETVLIPYHPNLIDDAR
jgi:hypothetical protein